MRERKCKCVVARATPYQLMNGIVNLNRIHTELNTEPLNPKMNISKQKYSKRFENQLGVRGGSSISIDSQSEAETERQVMEIAR